MTKKKMIAVALALATSVAADSATAQSAHDLHDPAAQPQAMQEMRMQTVHMEMQDMMAFGPRALLRSAEALDLSEEQSNRLQEIQALYREAIQTAMAQATGDAKAVLSEEQLQLADTQAARMGMMGGEGMQGMMNRMGAMAEGSATRSEFMGMMSMCMTMMGVSDMREGMPHPGGG